MPIMFTCHYFPVVCMIEKHPLQGVLHTMYVIRCYSIFSGEVSLQLGLTY